VKRLTIGIDGRLGFVPPAQTPRVLLALLLAAVMLVWWQAWQSLHPRLMVIFLDVGQGDSIIIRSPAGRSLLIDGGGGAGNAADMGETGRWVVIPALYRAGIRRIDGMIATHPHDDHIGGLPEVIEEMPVGMILDSGQYHPTPSYERFLEEAKKHQVRIIEARAGQVFNLGAGVRAEVLHPDAALLEGTEEDLNNNSVVLRLTFGDFSFLFTGDLQEEGEDFLLAGAPEIESTVLKAAHHGSLDSTSARFLSEVSPQWVVISAGRGNPFGHPHGQTLERLHKMNVRLFRTDEAGTIEMISDGESLKAKRGGGFRRPQAELRP
jgi:competence protein ComEC